MGLWKFLSGSVEVELTSARPEWLFGKLNEQGIAIYALRRPDMLTGRFWINRGDWEKARNICTASEGKITVLAEKGLHRYLRMMKKRKLLISGMILLLLMTLYLPGRVLFVKVEGNGRIPDRQILSAAESCGIRFGASRRSVRSEKVKNALLSELPQLQWAGVNTSGCVATVSVRERSEQAERTEPVGVRSIIASRDGYLLSATATRGNLLVHPGQSVKEGELLISGYTDCGISIRAEQAQGEIYAQTVRYLNAVSPIIPAVRRATGAEWKKISLLFGKKRIFLWKDSGILEGSCGRMYKEYYITLPGDFRLPLAVCVDRYFGCEEYVSDDSSEPVKEKLRCYAAEYITEQMNAGQIVHGEERFSFSDGVCQFSGKYICREMIGRVVYEQIGETNGENS